MGFQVADVKLTNVGKYTGIVPQYIDDHTILFHIHVLCPETPLSKLMTFYCNNELIEWETNFNHSLSATFQRKFYSHKVREKTRPSLKIENNFFQTVKNKEEISPYVRNLAEFNRKMQTGFNYHLYDDEDILKLYQDDINNGEEFASRALAAHKALNIGAYKADLFRYYIIYTRGGVWLDDKSILKYPLSNDYFGLNLYDGFLTDHAYKFETTETGFMGGVKHNELHRRFLVKCIENVEERRYCSNYWEITGPRMAEKILQVVSTGDGMVHLGGKTFLKLKMTDHGEIYIDDLIWKHKILTAAEIQRIYSKTYYTAKWREGQVYVDSNKNYVKPFHSVLVGGVFLLIFSFIVFYIIYSNRALQIKLVKQLFSR